MTQEEQNEKVVNAISNSSLIDFDSSLEWGQWCRDLACAALWGDDEAIDRLVASSRGFEIRNQRKWASHDSSSTRPTD